MELIKKNLDRVLSEKKWKPRDLARAMNVSDSHISQIRTGKRWGKRMEWGTYKKVCEALEVDELELLKPIHCGNAQIYNLLSKGMADLGDDDVTLIFNFLAVLKNRNILDKDHFQVLSLSLSWLLEELIQKKGEGAILQPFFEKNIDIDFQCN